MWKKIRKVLMIVLAAVFLFCGGTVAVVQYQYGVNKKLYREAAESFTEPVTLSARTEAGTPKPKESEEPAELPWWLTDGVDRLQETAPIKVDFEELRKVNPDVVGWLYCPDTVINYPVLHGEDNDQYLHHSYNGEYNASGSIFVDARNGKNFVDPLSIVYGHHMASGAMFATLDQWQRVEYFNEHPVMWLLTPTQDYKVELYSCYNTGAYSSTYSFFNAPDQSFAEYLKTVESYSAIRAPVELPVEDHYIVMSTCAYMFEDARSVLHGRLRPIMSTGGVPLQETLPAA